MSIRRKPVAKPQAPPSPPRVLVEESFATRVERSLFSSDAEATDFTVKLLSSSTLLETGLYHVRGLNQAVGIARQALSNMVDSFKAILETESLNEDAAMGLATVEGVTAVLGAFDNTGPDHFAFDDVRFVVKFCYVREALRRSQALTSPTPISSLPNVQTPHVENPNAQTSYDQTPNAEDPNAQTSYDQTPSGQTPHAQPSGQYNFNMTPTLPPRPLDGSGTTQPLSYVSPMVHYVGDGAAAANSAIQTTTLAVNNHIWAHNRRVQGAPLGQLMAYDFRKKDSAIYVQSLADCGLSRAQFADIVNTCERIRLGVKKEIDKKWIATATAASIASLGMTSFMFIGNIHKKSGAAMKNVELYFLRLNSELRQQNIPLVWQIKVAPFFAIEVTVTHSPI